MQSPELLNIGSLPFARHMHKNESGCSVGPMFYLRLRGWPDRALVIMIEDARGTLRWNRISAPKAGGTCGGNSEKPHENIYLLSCTYLISVVPTATTTSVSEMRAKARDRSTAAFGQTKLQQSNSATATD